MAATREVCVRWIKRMLAGRLHGQDDLDLKNILKRGPNGPRIEVNIIVSDDGNTETCISARKITPERGITFLKRAIAALEQEVVEYGRCPFHRNTTDRGNGR